MQTIQKFSPGTVQRAIVVNGESKFVHTLRPDFACTGHSSVPSVFPSAHIAPRILKILIAAARKLIKINAEIIVFAENETEWREKLWEYVPREQLCPAFGGVSTSCYAVK